MSAESKVAAPVGGHTPGPWAVGFSDGTGQTYITAGDHPALKRPEEAVVVVVAGCEDSWGVPQGVRNPADARLIAAAPTMYDFVQRAANAGDTEASAILEAIHGRS